jgi:HrpA-like RNA helicase
MTLFLLQAIDTKKVVTEMGRDMARFPLEPPLARSLLASRDHGCTLEIIDIISVLSASTKLWIDVSEERHSALEVRRKFQHSSGDHLTILNAVRSYGEIEGKSARKEWCQGHFLNERTLVEATKIRHQLRQTCNSVSLDWQLSCGYNEEPILRSLFSGLIQNSALLQSDGTYKQTMGRSVSLLGYFATRGLKSFVLGGEDSSWLHAMQQEDSSHHL